MGLLTTDLKYDAIRTEFQVSGRGRPRRASTPTSPPWRRARRRSSPPMACDLRDGHASPASATCAMSARATSCASPFPPAPLDPAALDGVWRRFHERAPRGIRPCLRRRARSRSSTSASAASARMPKIGALDRRARAASLDDGAGRARGRCVFRVDGALQRFETAFYRRDLLPVGEPSPGPPSSCRPTAPPWCRPAARCGPGTMRRGNPDHRDRRIAMSDARTARRQAQPAATARRSVTASVIQGALENIAIEMGYKLMRMSYSTHHPRIGGFRRGADRRRGPAAVRDASRARRCSRARSPATSAASCDARRRAARRSRPGDVIMHNDPYGGASHGPDVAFCVPVFHDGRADRLLGHHRAPPRHRRADAGQLRHRRCHRRLCRGPAVQGDQGRTTRAAATTRSGTCCATTSAPPTWWSATWRRRSPRPRSAPSAIVELVAPLRARHRQRAPAKT